MNVANKEMIRRLTLRMLLSDKRRNFFIITAIALTTFMITSVFSIGMSYYETMTLAPFRSEGVLVHAGFANPNPQRMETLRSLNYVRRIGTTYRVGLGYLHEFKSGIPIVATNEESWLYFQTPVYTGVSGRIAAAENEIMLSRAHLERMGIDEPYIGMEIPMEFVIGDYMADEYGEPYNKTFVLSAMYSEYVSLNPGNVYTPIFVSEAFAKQYEALNYGNMDVRILFTNQNRAVAYAKRLALDLNLESEAAVHPALEKQADMGSSTMYTAIGIIAAFFMLVGFLLIYNVMYISVSKDVRFYGLLKTIGTTPAQLRRIVNGQVLWMYIVGLPIVLSTAAVASFAIVPAISAGLRGTVVSFSPLIYIGGAVFALLTVYFGASTSARKAARVSPIEAVRYTGEQTIRIKPRSPANGKPSRMAWRNIFRERKRAVVVMLSLFMGITVFAGVMAIVNSMDIDGDIAYWYDYDIDIASSNTATGDLGFIGMDRGFIERIAAMPGVSEISEQTQGIAVFHYPQEIADYLTQLNGYYNPLLEITGIDRAYMEKLNEKSDNPIDIEAFERGETVLVYKRLSEVSLGGMLYEYFPIGAELFFELGWKAVVPVNVKISGYIDVFNATGYGMSAGGYLRIIMSNTFLKRVSGAGVSHIGVTVEEGMSEPVNAVISKMVKESGMAMASAYEARRAQEEARFTMFALGTALSGILALIGLFNFINLISVGIIARKRELATLESVGMSKRQMSLMLRWEGMIFWVWTAAASITAGTGISYGLFILVSNQSPAQFPRFVYPSAPVSLVLCLVVLICTLTPEICYRGISKMTLVERLREVE